MKDLLQTDSVFIAKYGAHGWRVRQKNPADNLLGEFGANSGIVEIMPSGRSGFINGSEPWSFAHPSVHMLYDEARIALGEAGHILPSPQPRLSRLEQMIVENLSRSPAPDLSKLRQLRNGDPVLCYADYTNQTRANEPHAQAMVGRLWGVIEEDLSTSMPQDESTNLAERGISVVLAEEVLSCHYFHYDPRRMQIAVIERPTIDGFTIRVLLSSNQWSGHIVPLEEPVFEQMIAQIEGDPQTIQTGLLTKKS